MGWTQAVCQDCWKERNPGRQAAAILPEMAELEVCCYCGTHTRSGIYVRVDPTSVPYPQP